MDVKKDRNALCRFDCAGIHLLMATTMQCYCFIFLSFIFFLLGVAGCAMIQMLTVSLHFAEYCDCAMIQLPMATPSQCVWPGILEVLS